MLYKSARNIRDLHVDLHLMKIPHVCAEFNREEKRLIQREMLITIKANYPVYHASYRVESRN
jgi:hypothetical protein